MSSREWYNLVCISAALTVSFAHGTGILTPIFSVAPAIPKVIQCLSMFVMCESHVTAVHFSKLVARHTRSSSPTARAGFEAVIHCVPAPPLNHGLLYTWMVIIVSMNCPCFGGSDIHGSGGSMRGAIWLYRRQATRFVLGVLSAMGCLVLSKFPHLF